MSFKDLKKKSSLSNLQEKLQKTEESNSSNSYVDERIWTTQLDKAGNGRAIIRFLPAVEGEDVPWVKRFNHGFQDKGGWFINNCPTTVGGKCPVCDRNSDLWNSGDEDDKDYVRKNTKRKLSYYSNIYVVSDPSNPDNNGKVFLFRYGKKIFDKIQAAMQPEGMENEKGEFIYDTDPINPFDFWEGANFLLRIGKVEGYANYDKSTFAAPEPLDDDDKVLEKIWKSEYPLQEFLADDQFKSYEDLEEEMDRVLNGTTTKRTKVTTKDEDEDEQDEKPVAKTKTTKKKVTKKKTGRKVTKPVEDDEPVSEDDIAESADYFKQLAESE